MLNTAGGQDTRMCTRHLATVPIAQCSQKLHVIDRSTYLQLLAGVARACAQAHQPERLLVQGQGPARPARYHAQLPPDALRPLLLLRLTRSGLLLGCLMQPDPSVARYKAATAYLLWWI